MIDAADEALLEALPGMALDDVRAIVAAQWATCATVSRHVAGVDDDVALAVREACDLAMGDAFSYGGCDPAMRAAWAWRRGDERAEVERHDREVQAELADLVRRVIG